MAKGLKFFYEFSSERGEDFGKLQRINIYVEGFSGTAIELMAGGRPYSFTSNKDVAENYLGGITPTSFTLEAIKTDDFNATSFTNEKYGDISFKHLIDGDVVASGIISPFEGYDFDLPSGLSTTSLGAECGLVSLKNSTYNVIGEKTKLITIVNNILETIPNDSSFGIEVIDNTKCYDTDGLLKGLYFDQLIDDTNFLGLSNYDTLKQILKEYHQLVFGDGLWSIRNIAEISSGDSVRKVYSGSTAIISANYTRPTKDVQRLAGGSFGKMFSQQNITVVKSKSNLRNVFVDSEFDSQGGWTYVGLAGALFNIENGLLKNNGNSTFTDSNLATNFDYVQSSPTSFYPYKGVFTDGETLEGLKIKLKAFKGSGIKNLRLQIKVQGGSGYSNFLNSDGTWYTQDGFNGGTPIYELTYSDGQEVVIDIPTPPYTPPSWVGSNDNLFPIGYFNNLLPNSEVPPSDIEYNLTIRVFLPERNSVDNPASLNTDANIEYIRVERFNENSALVEGYEKNYGVDIQADRKSNLVVNVGIGENTYPLGLDAIYASDNVPIVKYARYGSTALFNIDEYISRAYLSVLSNRLTFYEGSVLGKVTFTDLISIDSAKFRVHNLSYNSRANTSTLKVVQLFSSTNGIIVDEENTTIENSDLYKKIYDDITRSLEVQKLTFNDPNIQKTIGVNGQNLISLKPDVRHNSVQAKEVYLKSTGDGIITDVAENTSSDFTLIKPAKNGTYAVVSDIEDMSWLLTANTLTAKGFLGSTNAFDVGFKRNDVEYLTLNTDGISVLKDITSSGNLTLQKGNPRLRLRDTGAGGHTGGFDLHVNGDEFLIDDNTHSRNILRNYLNSSVHTTDFDAEVFNFKNGATNYARLNATSFNLPYLTPSQLVATDVSDNLVSLSTATYPSLTELSYLKGVTSAIQTQINGKFTLPSLTSGSVLFSNGTTISQSNAQLFWDNTNNRLGLGVATPSSLLHLRNTTGTQQLIIDDNTVRGSLQQSTQLFINGGTNVASGNTGTQIVFRQSSSFTEIARFNASGNFGIGVNPSYKLDVNGTGHFTGAVLFDAMATCAISPTLGSHLANKAYVDSLSFIKKGENVRTISTTNITLSGTQTINGVAVVANDLVLVTAQTTTSQNGVYVVSATAWTRSTLNDTDLEIRGAYHLITSGTFANQRYINTNASTITVGTTAITYALDFGAETDPIFVAFRDTSRGANLVYASGDGTASGIGTWRGLVQADIPTLNWSKLTATPTTISGYGITDYNSIWDTRLGTKTTTNLAEGSNQYYTNARAISSVLTGYISGAGVVGATDTVLQAIQKLNGNIGAISLTSLGGINFSTVNSAYTLGSNTTLANTQTLGVQLGNLQAQVNARLTDAGFLNKFALGNDFVAGNKISADGYTNVNIDFENGSINGFFINSPDGDSYFGSLETGNIFTLQGVNSGGTVGQFLHKNKVDNTLEWYSIVKADVGLGSVENTALSTWVGSANITTLGTITTGTWNASTIGVNKGGTGLTSLGTANQLIRVNSGATALEYFTPTFISGNQTITLSGDVGGSGTTSITTTLATITQANTGNFRKITLDTKGRVLGNTAVLIGDLTALGAITLGSLSSTATGLTYTNTTGVFSLTSGYSIPLNTSQTNWNTAFGWGNHASAGYMISANNPDLVAIEALTGTTGLLRKTALNTWSLDTTSYQTALTTSTIGLSVLGSTNPSAVTFLRANADNTATWLNASDYRTAIGAGTLSASTWASNYIPKYSSGTTTVFSQITDNGTTVKIGLQGIYNAGKVVILNDDSTNNLNNNQLGLYNGLDGIRIHHNKTYAHIYTIYEFASVGKPLILQYADPSVSYGGGGLGNVGIGLINPSQKLHVNGNIRGLKFIADSDASVGGVLTVNGNASFGLTNPLVISQKDYVQGATTAYYNEITSTGKWLRINTDSGFSLRHNEIDAISFDNDSWKFNTTFKVVQGEEINDWTGFNIDDRFRLGINDNTGLATFEMVYENSIVRNFFNEEGILSHIDTSGSVRKYLREGDIVGGGTNVIPNLQEVTAQGANSTIRMQFNGVNYATINDLSSSQGLDSVLGIGNVANNKNLSLKSSDPNNSGRLYFKNISDTDLMTLGLNGAGESFLHSNTKFILYSTNDMRVHSSGSIQIETTSGDPIGISSNSTMGITSQSNMSVTSLSSLNISAITTASLFGNTGNNIGTDTGIVSIYSNTGSVNLGVSNSSNNLTKIGKDSAVDFIYINGQKYNFKLPTTTSGDYLVFQVNSGDVTVKKATIFASGGKNYLTI